MVCLFPPPSKIKQVIYILFKQAMKIGEKEITLKPYTRGIDKEFNKVLFNGTKSQLVDWKQTLDIPPMNIQEANDYLVKAMTGLTDDEVLNLENSDYDKILEEINKIKNGEKSKGKN